MTKVFVVWDYRMGSDLDSIWSTRKGAEQRYGDLGGNLEGVDCFSIEEYELKQERESKHFTVEIKEHPVGITENFS